MQGINNIVITLVVCALGVLFVLYNGKVLEFASNLVKSALSFIYNLVGHKIADKGKDIETTIRLNKLSAKYKTRYKIYAYYDSILTSLEYKQYGISVTGFLIWVFIISLTMTLILTFVFSLSLFLALLLLVSVFVVSSVLYRLRAYSKEIVRDGLIMDTVDLLIADVRGGVQNAISRYAKNIHPDLRVYFYDFLDNVEEKGYSFNIAMDILNDRLGETFTPFASKAKIYENSADEALLEIFSGMVEANQQAKLIRDMAGRRFKELTLTLWISTAIIATTAFLMGMMDAYIANFFFHTAFGNILVIVDILLFAGILAYITAIKAKVLK